MGLLLVLLLVACLTSYASSSSEPWLDPSLPRSLTPMQYYLFLQPYINQRDFDGNVSIEIKVLNQTNFIIIHAEDLNISSTEVFVNNTTPLKVIRAFPYKTNSYWVVETEQPMQTGVPVKLNLVFSGNLSILTGIVKTGSRNEKTGDYIPMVMTSFKPNNSRRAFPNFDEPFFKSVFTVTLRHWTNLTAVSNMIEQGAVDIDSDWRETTFRRSHQLSSFTLSFIISNYTYKEGKLSYAIKYRVWARPEMVDRVDYALTLAPMLHAYYTRELWYFRTLQKIDHFAVPYLPYRGGHTCLGLISQNEDQLTFNSSRTEKHRLTNLALVAFEMARTYFGNLIVCEQWNHIWLESGLATFYGLKAAATVETISFYEQLLLERALDDDAFSNSRPLLSLTPRTTEEADIYHLLPFAKGAAVLKMLENFFGADAFVRGIRNYIRTNYRKTVLTQDLFDALQKYADASTNITEIMTTWVYSMGYPVITIQILPDNRVNATQKRFLMDPLDNPNSPPSTYGYKWYVPLSYRTERGKTGLVWINETDAVFDNLLGSDENWVIFNHNRSGYYRVNYERPLWDNITKQLKSNHTVFTDLERSQVVSDALKLTEAEQLEFDVALNLTMYASKERSPLIWNHVYNALENIRHHLSNTSELASYQRYVLYLTTNVMNELKVVDEGTVDAKLLRGKITRLSCSAGHRGCIENTTQLFKAWIQNDRLNEIPVNIRRSVYCSGIANSVLESEWNTTFNRFLSKGDHEERDELRLSLACSKNLTLLGRFLERCLSNYTVDVETVWYYDLARAAKKFSSYPAAAEYIWEWLKVNHAQIDARKFNLVLIWWAVEASHAMDWTSGFVHYRLKGFYPGASASLVPRVTYNFNTRAQLQEVRNFFAGMNSALVKRPKKETEDRIKANIRWIIKQLPTVSSWLQQNFPI